MTRPVALLLLFASSCNCTGGIGDTSRAVSVPETLWLGRVWSDEEARGVLRVVSSGTGVVRIESLSADGVDVEDPGIPYELAAGEELALAVRWLPGSERTLAATVTVGVDVEPRTRTVRVTGEARAVLVCDDGNPCTDDVFDRLAGACDAVKHDRACNDGSACTTDDVCRAGLCVGRALGCDDDDVCTIDVCDPATGCKHLPDTTTCDDGDPCTSDVCDGRNGCTHPRANDGTACGLFTCDTAHLCVGGTCRTLDVTGASDGYPCTDGDGCTEGDTCLGGACVGGAGVQRDLEVVGELPLWGRIADEGFGRFPDVGFVEEEGGIMRLAFEATTGSFRAVGRVWWAPMRVFGLGGGMVAVQDSAGLYLLDSQWISHAVLPTNTTADVRAGPDAVLTMMADGLVAYGGLGLRPPWARYSRWLPAERTFGTPVDLPIGSNRDAVAFNGDAIAWEDRDGFVWWGRLDVDGRLVEAKRVSTTPRTVRTLGVFARTVVVDGTDGGPYRIDLLSPGTGGEPVRCVSGSAGCLDLGPSCAGEFPWPDGSYVGCEDGAACPGGTSCVELKADTCPGCDLPCRVQCCSEGTNHVCLSDGAPAELATYAIRDWAVAADALVLGGDEVPAIVVSLASGAQESALPGSAPCVFPRANGDVVSCRGERNRTFVRRPAGDFLEVTGPGQGAVYTVAAGTNPREFRVFGSHVDGRLSMPAAAPLAWNRPDDSQYGVVVGAPGPLRAVTRDHALFIVGDDPVVRTRDEAGTLSPHTLQVSAVSGGLLAGDVAWLTVRSESGPPDTPALVPFLLDDAICAPLVHPTRAPHAFPLAGDETTGRLLALPAEISPTERRLLTFGPDGGDLPQQAFDFPAAPAPDDRFLFRGDRALGLWGNGAIVGLTPARSPFTAHDPSGTVTYTPDTEPLPLRLLHLGSRAAFVGSVLNDSWTNGILQLEPDPATGTLRRVDALPGTLYSPSFLDAGEYLVVVDDTAVRVLRTACH